MSSPAEKIEPKDCTSCRYLEIGVPSSKDVPMFVFRHYKCLKKNMVFLNREELIDAYKSCEEEKEVTLKVPVGSEIIDEVLTINTLFQMLTETKLNLFREDVRVTKDIMLPCKDVKDFRSKIGSVALIFNSENLSKLRKLLEGEKNWKSVKLIENWLKKKSVSYDPEMIVTWEKIIKLRNLSYPYHPESNEMMSLFRYFEQGFPINYSELWESILKKLLSSLRMFKSTMTFMIREKK